MKQPPKSPNSPTTRSSAATLDASSRENSETSPSQGSNSKKQVSRYQASEEEQARFAERYSGDLVITMSNAINAAWSRAKPGSPTPSAASPTIRSRSSTNSCPGVTLRLQRNSRIVHAIGLERRTVTIFLKLLCFNRTIATS